MSRELLADSAAHVNRTNSCAGSLGVPGSAEPSSPQTMNQTNSFNSIPSMSRQSSSIPLSNNVDGYSNVVNDVSDSAAAAAMARGANDLSNADHPSSSSAPLQNSESEVVAFGWHFECVMC